LALAAGAFFAAFKGAADFFVAFLFDAFLAAGFFLRATLALGAFFFTAAFFPRALVFGIFALLDFFFLAIRIPR
jgi:hypothetical protein